MIVLLHSMVQKVAAAIMALFATIGGILARPNVIVIAPQESAIVQIAVALPSEEIGSSTDSSTATNSSAQMELPPLTPGLLPKARPLRYKITGDTKTEIRKNTGFSGPVPISNSAVTPKTTTAQWLLERTTLSFGQKRDGSYEAILTTATNNKENLQWGLNDATFGGNGPIPQFNVSFSCDPPPDLPLPDTGNQNPFFVVRTSYRCTISLMPSTGLDRRTQSKQFSFQTGAGQLIITPASVMNTVLKNDKNSGGFVFDNKDMQPVTITSLKLDLSYTALSTSSSQLIMELFDPRSEQVLYHYHMEDFPADPFVPFTQSRIGVELPLSFAIGPNSQKMLGVQVLGVRKFHIPGVDPAVKIILRGLTTDRGDVKTTLGSSQIFWTCAIPTGQYDPNATSGPFITGQVCRD